MVLSYRHAYHAGNAGDVVKHSILSLVLCSLAKKDKPYFFLDTHAAAGQYALDQQQPGTSRPLNREYATGIGRLWTQRHTPRSLAPYMHTVRSINGFTAAAANSSSASSSPTSDDSITDEAASAFSLPITSPMYGPDAYQLQSLRHYPGSPAVFMQLRRPQDRMLAIEKHNTEHHILQQFLHSQSAHRTDYPYCPPSSSAPSPSSTISRPVRPSRVMHDDFVASLPLLPPPERRGLVFIDPPYELSSEYDGLVGFMRDGHRRWQSGSWMLWYPLLHGKEQQALDMIDSIASLGSTRLLDVRFSLYSHMADRLGGRGADVHNEASNTGGGRMCERVSLYGCGVLLINPPYLLDSLLSTSLLPFLSRALASSRSPADFSVRWLTPQLQQSTYGSVAQHNVDLSDAAEKK